MALQTKKKEIADILRSSLISYKGNKTTAEAFALFEKKRDRAICYDLEERFNNADLMIFRRNESPPIINNKTFFHVVISLLESLPVDDVISNIVCSNPFKLLINDVEYGKNDAIIPTLNSIKLLVEIDFTRSYFTIKTRRYILNDNLKKLISKEDVDYSPDSDRWVNALKDFFPLLSTNQPFINRPSTDISKILNIERTSHYKEPFKFKSFGMEFLLKETIYVNNISTLQRHEKDKDLFYVKIGLLKNIHAISNIICSNPFKLLIQDRYFNPENAIIPVFLLSSGSIELVVEVYKKEIFKIELMRYFLNEDIRDLLIKSETVLTPTFYVLEGKATHYII